MTSIELLPSIDLPSIGTWADKLFFFSGCRPNLSQSLRGFIWFILFHFKDVCIENRNYTFLSVGTFLFKHDFDLIRAYRFGKVLSFSIFDLLLRLTPSRINDSHMFPKRSTKRLLKYFDEKSCALIKSRLLAINSEYEHIHCFDILFKYLIIEATWTASTVSLS